MMFTRLEKLFGVILLFIGVSWILGIVFFGLPLLVQLIAAIMSLPGAKEMAAIFACLIFVVSIMKYREL